MRRALAIAAVSGAAALGLASPAGAATYDIVACGPGGTNKVWVPLNTSPATLTVTQACPPAGSESGLFVGDAAFAGTDTPGGAVAEWVFTAPTGATISGVLSSDWKLAIGNTGWVSYLRDGAGNLLDPCLGIDCKLGLPSPGGLLPVAFQRGGLNTNALAFGVACTSPSHCVNGGGPGQHDAAVSVHAVVVTLDDPTQPDLAPATGGLADTQNWLRGVQSIAVGASQAVSGVSRLHVRIDGADVPGSPVVVACDYTQLRPCPPSAQAALSLDTTTLFDGEHTVSIGADNASPTPQGQRTASWKIRVDNGVPVPLALRAQPAPQAGVPFSAYWDVAPGRQGGPKVRADWRLVPVDGGAGSRSGTVASASDITHIDGLVPPRQGAWTLGVTLTDAAGNRGAEASALLTVRPAPPRIAGRRVLVPLVPQARPRRFEARLIARGRTVVRRFVRLRPRARLLVVPIPRRLPQGSYTVRLKFRPVGARHFSSCLFVLARKALATPCVEAPLTP